jgi:hypothetical protein
MNEALIDELAAAASADPIDFRLKYLDPADLRGNRGDQSRRRYGEMGQASLSRQEPKWRRSHRAGGVLLQV